MPENENIENVENTTETNYNEYIEAIKNLKSNTVSKEQYQQLQNENKALLENLVNGQVLSTDDTTAKEDKKPIIDLKKELFYGKELSDIEYVSKALELRNRLLEDQGIDCFVGSSHSLSPTQEDYDKAEKVAKVLQECLDNCNGSNKIFISTLQDRMTDIRLPGRR